MLTEVAAELFAQTFMLHHELKSTEALGAVS